MITRDEYTHSEHDVRLENDFLSKKKKRLLKFCEQGFKSKLKMKRENFIFNF